MTDAVVAESHPQENATQGLLDRWSDRFSPIVIKEIRQAIRGRSFRVTFVTALTFAVVVAAMTILSISRNGLEDGRPFFLAMHTCLAIAMLWFVPFSAYQAMAAEWTENTYDLLVISNLKPKQIVLGKWLAAMVQGALYTASFLPFLVLSFLLQGVDLLVAALAIGFTFSLTATLVLVALFLSTFAKKKALQGVLLAGVMGLAVPATGMSLAFSGETLNRPGSVQDFEFLLAASGVLLGLATLGTYCFLGACVSLSHVEENRSTGLRVASVVTMLLALTLLLVGLIEDPDREALSGVSMFILAWIALPALFFVTEPERLGRRVVQQVPSSALGARLAEPFLPGGARGVVLLVSQLVLLLAFNLVGQLKMSAWDFGDLLDEGFTTVLVGCLYVLVVLLPLSGWFAVQRGSKGRIALRVGIPSAALLAMILPGLLGLMVGDRDLMQLEHVGNPIWLIEETFTQRGAYAGILALYVLLGFVALVLQVGRLRSARAELTAARVRSSRKDAGGPVTDEPSSDAAAS